MVKTKYLRIGFYIFLLFVLYILVITPNIIPRFFGTAPLVLLPFSIAVAMIEGEFVGGIMGGISGLLVDITSSRVQGFSALIFLLLCVAAGLLVEYLIRQNYISFIILCFFSLSTYILLEYLFFHLITNNKFGLYMLINKGLPLLFYTLIVSPLLYYIVLRISGKLYEAE